MTKQEMLSLPPDVDNLDYDEEDFEDYDDPDERLFEAYEESVCMTDGTTAYEINGDYNHYVMTENLFKPDGTLIDKFQTIYFESHFDVDVMRIEKDGSYILVSPPSTDYDGMKYNRLIRGRVGLEDLNQGTVSWFDGKEKPIIFFNHGVGYSGGITTITAIPEKTHPYIYHITESTYINDVEERFNTYVTYASLNPEI